MYNRDPFDVCDEPTKPDHDAEWRAAAWEAYDAAKDRGEDVATPESVRRYSEHLRREAR